HVREGRPRADPGRAVQQPARQEGLPVREADGGDPPRRRGAPRAPRLQRHLSCRSGRSAPARRHRPAGGYQDARGQPEEGEAGEALLMSTATAEAPAAPVKKGTTDRAKAERRTAWLLCTPAVVVMLLVTGYPIVSAFVLSLQKYDLRFPAEKKFVGLDNYGDVLTSSTWWTDVFNTVIITVFSVGLELVLGMLIALV